MKLGILTIIIFLNSSISFSQCQQGINSRDFQMLKSQIFRVQNSDQIFQKAVDASKTNCFTSLQSKEIANLLMSDRDRYDFLKSAFTNITDKDNFTDVLDVFKNYSMAFKLYHNTLNSSQFTSNSIQSNPIYSGNKSCNNPMSMQEFTPYNNLIKNQLNDRLKASSILTNLQGKCILTQQMISSASQIYDENIKLDILKRMYSSIYDIDNYGQAAQLLNNQNKEIFNTYIQSPSNVQSINSNCTISSLEFSDFIKSINKMSFDQDKSTQIKTSLLQRCLTSQQVKELVLVSNYESTRVQIAKDMYDNCVDKNNYYKVNESFKMSSSISELNEYISGKH